MPGKVKSVPWTEFLIPLFGLMFSLPRELGVARIKAADNDFDRFFSDFFTISIEAKAALAVCLNGFVVILDRRCAHEDPGMRYTFTIGTFDLAVEYVRPAVCQQKSKQESRGDK